MDNPTHPDDIQYVQSLWEEEGVVAIRRALAKGYFTKGQLAAALALVCEEFVAMVREYDELYESLCDVTGELEFAKEQLRFELGDQT